MPENPLGPLDPDLAMRRRRRTLAFLGAVFAVTCIALGATVYGLSQHLGASSEPALPVLRPTGTILMAIRDVARLETSELHLEKVIDLTDKQSRFFGLLNTSDAVLLIAAGDVTYALYERVLHQSAPFPSLADVLYLAGCPLIGVSLIGIMRTRSIQNVNEIIPCGILSLANREI